jgi:elongation factor Tu
MMKIAWLPLALLLLPQAEPARPSAKPVVKVAVAGHQDHGKSTLTAAITRVLSDAGGAKLASYEELSASPVARVEYETEKARYSHADCRTDEDCKKLLSEGKLDGIILVVSAPDGPMPQTREQIQLAHKSGVPAIVVYLNKIDLVNDPDLLALEEREIRELLSRNGFKGDTVPIIRGSAYTALTGGNEEIGKSSILALLSAMDEAFVK